MDPATKAANIKEKEAVHKAVLKTFMGAVASGDSDARKAAVPQLKETKKELVAARKAK